MRNSIQDFSLANPIYIGATITAWTVSGGVKTATKATLYAGATGTATLSNPQNLDSYGKFQQPVYIEDPVIITVSGLTIPDHDTGILQSVLAADQLAEVYEDLASTDDGKGADLIGGAPRWVSSISALRLRPKTGNPRAFVPTYYEGGAPGRGGGNYLLDPTDTTSADNGGTIIVGADGGRWKLVWFGSITLFQFGAKGDGTNDSPAIQAAIDWSETTFGARLHAQAATYGLATGLTMVDTQTILFGDGTEATTFQALAAMDAMITHSKTSNSAGDVYSGGVRDIKLDGNELAGIGIQTIGTLSGVFEHIRIRRCTDYGVLAKCDAGGPSSQKNHWSHIYIGCGGAAATAACVGFKVTGNEDVGGESNFSLNYMEQVNIELNANSTGDAFVFGFSDGNTLNTLHVYRDPTATGRGLVFMGSDSAVLDWSARNNVCFNVQAGNNSGVHSLNATVGSFHAGPNTVVALNGGNGGAAVTTESGAVLHYLRNNEMGSRGTWTPIIGGSTTMGTQTYSVQLGMWEKIGNICYFTARIVMTARDAATAGNLQITGLPTTLIADNSLGNNMRYQVNVSAAKFDMPAGYSVIYGSISPGGQTISLSAYGDNVSTTTLVAGHLLADTTIVVSGFFFTTA